MPAAILRFAIARTTARRVVPDKVPRPIPTAKVASKVDDASSKKGWRQYAESLVKEHKKRFFERTKKKLEPPSQDWKAAPLLIAMIYPVAFLTGFEVGHEAARRVTELKTATKRLTTGGGGAWSD